MTALYVLAQEYRAAAASLADLDLDEQTLADTLESLSGDLEVKAVNTAMVVRNMQSLAASIKEAEASMAARRKALEARAERLTAYLLQNMQATGITKIESPHFALTVKNNPASVVINEPGLIPAEFMRQPEPPPPAPDKTAIKEAIKAGKEVPGAHMVQGVRLEIK
ncbi:siphovirus Gp157 family protein [Caldimonas sp. KR1-144]|uniref:siphovirus Gp157 family protein n=1 Tax=Caldimonas sp. KR1-144 TaxID=3400911 RepID=UPI003C121604